ncbi:MAG: glycosyltransferase family 2 protein, partial [Deltaproteobacteria bacterium]
EIAILPAPLLLDYRLDGSATRDARSRDRHRRSREALRDAVATWAHVARLPGTVLGFGQEGVVRRHGGDVIKHFYPGILSHETVERLSATIACSSVVPNASFEQEVERRSWVARYTAEPTTPFVQVEREAVTDFLRRCLAEELVCANVKRSNFRVREDGSLLYVDVGNWIIPMDVSYFRDAAARLYAIGVLGTADEELQRRPSDPSQPEIWEALPGFASFYGDAVGGWARAYLRELPAPPQLSGELAPDVTLLLKACAMDARDLRAQVVHLVDQLSRPRTFARRLLLIDPFPGPFLRQHAPGDLDRVMREARELVREGWLDEILVGPTEGDEIQAINQRWFGVPAEHTHAIDGIPVTPQVWAFDQVDTRYVLQGDVDVLVGRRDRRHDYLAEMMTACAPPDVVCVAFNIPQPSGRRPYDAPPGEYKPEVRLGLLDLDRLRALLPLPASMRGGRLTTTWYRALHQAQRVRSLRTVRGGDASTFYLHPPNDRKQDEDALARVRDLVAQGQVPPAQLGRWDLEVPAAEWRYRSRGEPVVVLALGRNTPDEKVRRFAQGLAGQDRQDFGVIVIDDASDTGAPSRFIDALGWLGERLTLVRHSRRRGRVANYRLGIGRICRDPETMIVIVDLDDALFHPTAVREVAEAAAKGHDIVLAAPFRPDAPTKVYAPEFARVRETFGGDVWIHLRAFRKRLFDALPDAALELDGRPLENLVDYATMIPMVERARSPIYLPSYRYWHERSTVLDEAGERRRDETILRILAKGPDGREP